ncbi:MAG: Ribosomal small subunit methyltransferase [Firmicutes bacterium]|nr:Ribosomal small subunit methyltransferase [Bacillota bacterium]
MRRFFINEPLRENIIIEGPDARHIGQVLRMVPGAEIVVVGLDGQAGRAGIVAIKATTVEAVLIEKLDERREPPIEVCLAQGLPKSDKMEYIIQKAVEIGAVCVIPMAVRFSTVHYDEQKKRARVERWQKIAQEAAKQCGRGIVPTVAPVQSLIEVLEEVKPDTRVIMLYEGETRQNLKAILSGCQAKSYLILVGPEGGFSPDEVEACKSHGACIATLGPRILRTETAAVVALSIIMYQNGDLG